jgi:Ca-activated chloride channel family protein
MACPAHVRLVLAAAVVAASASAQAAGGERPAGLYVGGRAVPVVASAVELRVTGPFVEGKIVQRFRNSLDRPIEAVYVFPLPDDAAVSSLVVRSGDRTIVAHVEDRAGARRRYEAAVAAGAPAALLEEERADVFTQAVTAIPPGGEVSIELAWDGAIAYQSGTWQLTVPLVVGPRAVPGAATGRPSQGTGASPDTDRAPDASRLTPDRGAGVPTTVALHIDGLGPLAQVEVLSHDAKITTSGGRADIAISDASSDRDVRVHWTTPAQALGALTDADGFVAMVVPAPARAEAAARDWILIADTAARLDGDGLVLVRRAVRALLAQIGPRDRVMVIDGAGVVQVPRAAGATRARTWIEGVRAAGESDLAAAITAATARARGGARIVLVSDGLVADDAAVLAAAGAARLSTIAVGPAPNHALLDGLAARTGGLARSLAVADDAEPIAAALAVAERPVAAIDWGGLEVEQVPAVLPAMAPGDAIVVVGRVRAPGPATVRAAGQTLTLPATWAVTARPSGPAVTSARLLGRRWARARIEALITAGGADDQVRALGLGFGLVTPMTALVAIGNDTVVRGGVATSVAVPVAQPAGMRWQVAFHEAPPTDTKVDATTINRAPAPTPPPTGAGTAPAGHGGHADDRGGEDGDREEVDRDGRSAPTAPPEPRAPRAGDTATRTESGAVADEAEVIELTAARDRRWRGALTLGAGGLLAPERGVALTIAARLEDRLSARSAIGFESALLVAPTADQRVALSLLAVALREVARGRLALEVGLGAQLGSDSGLGYTVGARVGHRVGFVLRWDGAVLSTDQGAVHRGQLTGGLELGF